MGIRNNRYAREPATYNIESEFDRHRRSTSFGPGREVLFISFRKCLLAAPSGTRLQRNLFLVLATTTLPTPHCSPPPFPSNQGCPTGLKTTSRKSLVPVPMATKNLAPKDIMSLPDTPTAQIQQRFPPVQATAPSTHTRQST